MDVLQIKHALALKEAKNEFNKLFKEDAMQCLHMIDAVQRLSIEHIFEEEIQKALLMQNLIISDSTRHIQLAQVALQFRLLRQAGHYVHADIFDNFMGKQGVLKEEYREDIKGLIALYEASQLSIEGEDSLDDAGKLSRQLLETWLSKNEGHHEAQVVANALENPLHLSLSRFNKTNTILSSNDVVMRSNRWAGIVVELAEINSSLIRHINKNELLQVSKWWKEVGVSKEMKFSKLKPVKWYMWSMACLTDPMLSEQRIELIKPVSLVYIIDDIFDVYGSLDELIHFTNAVKRWDSISITKAKLPDYMKTCFNLLDDTINELASKVQEKHGLNPAKALKKSWAALLNSFVVEATWLKSGDFPKAKEYLKNGIVSSGVHVVLLHAFLLLDQSITQETIFDQIPTFSSLVGKILRLCDDLEGSKSDDQNGLDGSYLECYMKENEGVSIVEAQTHVDRLISNAWKHLNEEILITTNPFPLNFTKFCLNASRMVFLMYSYRRNQGFYNLQEYVKSLLHVDEASYERIQIPPNPKGCTVSQI